MVISYLSGNFYFAMGALFLLAIQSAVYSPAKFGLIIDIYGKKNLSNGNAALQAVSIIAILFSIASASFVFENFYNDGWLPNGVLPIFSTLLTVVFAFSGTEVVGVAAGETKDPAQAIPKAVHTTVLRLAIFFIGSIAVMSALIPWHRSGVEIGRASCRERVSSPV